MTTVRRTLPFYEVLFSLGYDELGLVICGHSLGAGVGALLALVRYYSTVRNTI